MMLGVVLFILLLLVLDTKVTGCSEKITDIGGEENKMSAKTIEKVLEERTDDLMAIPGVVGTGQGLCNGKPCIKVFVIKKTPQLDKKIPDNLDSHPVVIEETGEFRALPENSD
jgi:hypothetical protein